MGIFDIFRKKKSDPYGRREKFGETPKAASARAAAGAGGGSRDVNRLAALIGIEADLLRKIKPAYREFKIPKRSGGTRVLSAPEDNLKAIQKLILRRVLGRLRAHPAATGFERGRSIADNAAPHVRRAVVIRMDVKDFFTTTSAERVEEYFGNIGWNREAARLLTTLCTWKGGLPQGAPTSPRLSNLVNFGLDAALAGYAANAAARFGVTAAYTRYADDITFSLDRDNPEAVRGLTGFTRQAAWQLGYRLHRRKKTHIRRAHQRQVVTGLVVNERLRLPRDVRRRLRAARHRALREPGRTDALTPAQLDGWAAFEGMIDRAGG